MSKFQWIAEILNTGNEKYFVKFNGKIHLYLRLFHMYFKN